MLAPRCAPYPGSCLRSVWYPLIRRLSFVVGVLLALAPLLSPTVVRAAPQLWLPTPPGEPWKIIQGYGCGSHDGYDRYSLDIVRDSGDSAGAPVLAAADGTVWNWVPSSGSLILDHGGGFRTIYNHMQNRFFNKGEWVSRGAVIGTVGNTGASWTVPHLDFAALQARGPYDLGTSVPLSFAEGVELPDKGGCNQYGGEILVSANGKPDEEPPTITFTNSVEVNRWYNSDQRIEFVVSDDVLVRGFSQEWNRDPGGDAPTFERTTEGYVQTAWAGEGMHEIVVRAWDVSGKQTVAAFGSIGYDATPPGVVGGQLHAAAYEPVPPTGPITLTWQAAPDNGSGVIG